MRVCVYFIDSSLKRMDSYILGFLEGIKEIAEKIVIVNNANLDLEVISNMQDISIVLTDDSLKELFFNKEYSIIEDCTEVVFCDKTFMGPIYSFKSMMEKMEFQGEKAWNIIPVKKSNVDGFFVVKRELVTECMLDEVFISKNLTLGEYLDNKDITINHYIDTTNFDDKTLEPMLMYPMELVKSQRCPVFDHEVFVKDYFSVLEKGTGLAARELYDYLKNNTEFNIDVLWDKLLKDYNQADIAKNLNLNYVICKEQASMNVDIKNKKIVLIMHLYYSDLFEHSISFATSVPEQADIYITTNSIEKKQMLEPYLKRLKPRKCEVRVIPNRGRDVSSLLVGVKDVISNYEYACFVHDKKSSQTEYGSTGEGFYSRIFQNTLFNADYVANIIALFEKEKRLGLLSPATPNHSDYFTTLGQEWGINFENTKQLADELNLNVSIDPMKEPVAPFGTCFWFRVDALQTLYNKNWEYEDFPMEPNGTDGTLLHAVERIYPYVVQSQGYYPAFMLEKGYAELDLTNLQFYVRDYNYILLNFGEIGGRITDMCQKLENHLNGGETPMAQRLHEYIEAHDRVNNEWKKTAQLLQATQNEYDEIRNAYDRVNEEWRKTAELLKVVQEAHDTIENKYNKTLRCKLERLMNNISNKCRNI